MARPGTAPARSPCERRSCLPSLLLSRRARRLGERSSEGLEDRLENVLGVLAVEQPDMHRHPCRLGELTEEAGHEVPLEARDMGVGEVDVRDEQRTARRLDD